jgi:rhomboid domain-containing protein 1
MHVYYNMSSLVWKGVNLEQSYGSVKFAALVGELLLLSHGLVLAGSALLAAYIPEYRSAFCMLCTHRYVVVWCWSSAARGQIAMCPRCHRPPPPCNWHVSRKAA